MVHPEVYNDEAHRMYHIMTSIKKDMVGIDEGVKAMVIHDWCGMMDENLRWALAKEKGRVAGERVANAITTGVRTVVKWVKRALVTGALVMVGVVVFNHGGDWYKELKSTQAVYQLDDAEVLDKSDEYVIVEVPVEVPVPGHKPNR